MAKKYVVENCVLNCQYGTRTCGLKPWSDRHISAAKLLMANETDIGQECFDGNFGTCRSPYADIGIIPSISVEMRNNIDSIQQLAWGAFPKDCEIGTYIPWQNSRSNVHLGGYRALMEDGWTVCNRGLGIITVVNCGQAEVDQTEEILSRLAELEAIVDQYMQENEIKEKYRDELLESVLLWHGYPGYDMLWDYTTNERTRAFNSYLEKENPALTVYFERKLYAENENGEPVDLTYMMGIFKAIREDDRKMEAVSDARYNSNGLQNGCQEAIKQFDNSELESSYDLLVNYLTEHIQ